MYHKNTKFCPHWRSSYFVIITMKEKSILNFNLCITIQFSQTRAMKNMVYVCLLACCLLCWFFVKVEVICVSKTSLDFHWTMQHYISEVRILQIRKKPAQLYCIRWNWGARNEEWTFLIQRQSCPVMYISRMLFHIGQSIFGAVQDRDLWTTV
jgi:hypothetical protein